MPRLLAFNALFFLLPFAVYAGWLLVKRGSLRNASDWPMKTIGWLAIIGAVVMLASMVVFVTFSGGSPGSVYVPAKVEDGVLVPGHFD